MLSPIYQTCITSVMLILCAVQARIQDFLKGGGVETFTRTPPPLDIVCVHPPSEKLKNTPTLGHSQACTIHIPGCVCVITPVTHTHSGSTTVWDTPKPAVPFAHCRGRYIALSATLFGARFMKAHHFGSDYLPGRRAPSD